MLQSTGAIQPEDFDYACACGRRHSVEIECIKIGSGILTELSAVLEPYKNGELFVVGDENTYRAMGSAVAAILQDGRIKQYIFSEKHLIPDEKALGKLLIEMPAKASLIIAVGSGTINDLCRYLSYKTKIPYIILCTAPSMDGYASVVSPLIVRGVKTTYNAVYPKAILADIDIMRNAPMQMLQAGLGDILGKYTALADWQLARLLQGEYYCEGIERQVREAVHKCVSTSGIVLQRSEAAVERITEALILSGLAIGMVDSSRPASGEEHHLSHCWEMLFMKKGEGERWLHGNLVGVGTVIAAEAYEYLNRLNIREIAAAGKYKSLSRESWEAGLEQVYGENAKDIIAFKQEAINFDPEARTARMQGIVEHWETLKLICLQHLPAAEELMQVLKNAGAVCTPGALGLTKELFQRSVVAAKDIRKRYGIFQLLEDIGELDNAAAHIANKYYD